MERDLLGQATLPDPLTDQLLTAARESQATIFEWRAAMGPIGPRGDHNEPAEWQYQTALCSQTFEDLPNQLEQLVIGREGRGQQRRQPPPSERLGRSTATGDLPLIYRSPPRVENRGGDGHFNQAEDGLGKKLKGGQLRLSPASPPPPPPQPALQVNTPTPFKTMFDGTTSKLAFFMNRA
ncbi:hypothetical protein E2320_002481, partial [Naja naja]